LGFLTRGRHSERFNRATQAVYAFWGSSDGGELALNTATGALEEQKLTLSQIGALRAGLPPAGPGTTGDRIRRIDRVLKRLEHQAQ